MKADVQLRPACFRDAAPQPVTFCFTVFWKQEKKMRQFLRCGCNFFICPGWRSRHVTYQLYLWRNWEISTSMRSRKKIPNETWLQSVEHILVVLLRDSRKQRTGFRFDILVIWDSFDSLSPEVLVLRSLWIGRRGANQVDLSGEIQFRQVMLQPKWLFFRGRLNTFKDGIISCTFPLRACDAAPCWDWGNFKVRTFAIF